MTPDKPYPKQMRHPAERVSVCIRPAGTNGRFDPGEWTQAQYLPVYVQNEDQEAEHRAKGYAPNGEGAQSMLVYQEYPKMLQHPGFVPEVLPVTDAKMQEGRVVTVVTPGRPSVNPPVTVHSPQEEAEWSERGYTATRAGDPQAFSASVAAPRAPGGYVPQRYPMMVGDRLVHNEAQEAEARGTALPPAPVAAAASPSADVGNAALLAEMQTMRDELAALKGKKAAIREKRTAGLAKARKAKAEKAAEAEAPQA